MSKTLVAYFSASGVTAKIAEELVEAAKADLYEIVPAQKYSAADLDWTNKKSRSTLEMTDPSSRPELGGASLDVAPYDVIYVGFPIWWGVAPHVVNTFLEAHDFSGKTIVPFATSGGSGMGNTVAALRPSAPNAVFKEGKRMGGSEDLDALKVWTDGLGL